MSRTRLNEIESKMLEHDCDHCGQPAGEWCTTTSGRWSHYLHAERWYAWKSTQ